MSIVMHLLQDDRLSNDKWIRVKMLSFWECTSFTWIVSFGITTVLGKGFYYIISITCKMVSLYLLAYILSFVKHFHDVFLFKISLPSINHLKATLTAKIQFPLFEWTISTITTITTIVFFKHHMLCNESLHNMLLTWSGEVATSRAGLVMAAKPGDCRKKNIYS